MEQYLTLGKIIDTFSLDGTLKVLSSTSNQDIRYKPGNKVLIKLNDEMKEFTIASFRKSGNLDFVRFNEITSVELAKELKGKDILVVKNQEDLKEGYYFYSDLVGCSIVSDNKELGKVIEVEEFPAQITLRAKTVEGKQFFIPFIKVFIKKVDIQNKTIEINYMEGML